MKEIPRGLILLKPKQPFVDWLRSWADEVITLEEAAADLDAILIPEFESTAQALEFVRANAKMLLEHVLREWCTATYIWPVQRDFEQLCHWFEVIPFSMVFDAGAPDGGNRGRKRKKGARPMIQK